MSNYELLRYFNTRKNSALERAKLDCQTTFSRWNYAVGLLLDESGDGLRQSEPVNMGLVHDPHLGRGVLRATVDFRKYGTSDLISDAAGLHFDFTSLGGDSKRQVSQIFVANYDQEGYASPLENVHYWPIFLRGEASFSPAVRLQRMQEKLGLVLRKTLNGEINAFEPWQIDQFRALLGQLTQDGKKLKVPSTQRVYSGLIFDDGVASRAGILNPQLAEQEDPTLNNPNPSLLARKLGAVASFIDRH